MKDYYKILGIDRNSSPEDIKKAYRSLAMKYHPDKAGNDPESERKFKEISEAYEILSDPQKKASHDNPNPFGGGGFNFGGGFYFGGGFEDLFRNMGGRNNTNRVKNGQNINAKILINLADVMNGSVKKANVFRRVRCTSCQGSGAKNNETNTCQVCAGAGSTKRMVNTAFGQVAMEEVCYNCQGEKVIPKSICPSCSGSGTQRINDNVEIQIPKGSVSGMSFLVSGMGDFTRGNGMPGDLIVTVSEISHDFYKRDALNLVCHKTISFYQACIGTELEIPNPSGEGSYKIKVPAGTQSGKMFRLQGKGIPEMGGGFAGDIMMMIDVTVPKNLNPHQLEILKEFDLTLLN